MELITGENDKGRRLDRILRKSLPEHPLPLLHRLLRQGKVLVDGKPAKAQDRLGSGVKITIPSLKDALPASRRPPKPISVKPDILWQGEGLLAVNKPAGLAVHGPTARPLASGQASLDEAVRAYLADKLPPSLSFKPGPLHRLDKPSSGIVVFSTSIEGARLFTSLMREHKVKKTYLAIVEGAVGKEQVWEDMLVRDKGLKKTFVSKDFARRHGEHGDTEKEKEGKRAVTRVKPLSAKDGYSLIEAEIETGRTHQIRAQAAAHGYPLAGDRKYGAVKKAQFARGFFLHAWKMEFLDIKLEAPLPPEFAERKKLSF
jgi:23S rRNA pseudouridine955/2504/2580 synthase